jgi:hypothetical protein
MMNEASLRKALCGMIAITPVEDGLRVSTHCLYPSNGAVTLTVRGNGNEFVISDDCGALDELSSSGDRKRPSDRQIRSIIKNQGLKVKDGAIYSPVVPLDAVPAAIILVANAAKVVAEWGYAHIRFTITRNFKTDLAELLQRHFNESLKCDLPIIGESNKRHKFRYVIYLPEDRKLLIDPVVNDPSSINARVVANIDVRMAKDPSIVQYIVYDDAVEWLSSDLRLLRVGAPTLPFSEVETTIDRFAA